MDSKLYQRLKAERAALDAEWVALDAELGAQTGALSEADDARLADFDKRSAANRAALDREEGIRERLRNAPAVESGVTSVRDLGLEKPWGFQFQQIGAKPEIVKAGAFGEYLVAVQRAGMGQGTDPRLAIQAAASGAGAANPADGGFLVQHEMQNEIALRMMTGEILSRVDGRTLTSPTGSITYNQVDESSRATGSRFGGVQGYWVDEGTAPTASKPTFWKLKLEPSKVAALYRATDELLLDVVELGRTV
ncbi:MAG TPA: phage major capsid protein, partial [Terriglobales bacterium]|nr:phage major capsid protein [Terriglobales bacterium]